MAPRAGWTGTLVPEDAVVARWRYLVDRSGNEPVDDPSSADAALVVAVPSDADMQAVPGVPCVVVADSSRSSSSPRPMSTPHGSVALSVSPVPESAFTDGRGAPIPCRVVGPALSAYAPGVRDRWRGRPGDAGRVLLLDVDGSMGPAATGTLDSLSGLVDIGVSSATPSSDAVSAVRGHMLVIPCPTVYGDSVAATMFADRLGAVVVHPESVGGFTAACPKAFVGGVFDLAALASSGRDELARVASIQSARCRNVRGVMDSAVAAALSDALSEIAGRRGTVFVCGKDQDDGRQGQWR